MNFTDDEIKILWAAMAWMVWDAQAPQEQLTMAEWGNAESLMARLDDHMNEKRGTK